MDTRRKAVKLQVKNTADIDALGEDIVAEILSKLPVKSLLRSRSVSKTWYALTNTDYFIQKHIIDHHQSESDNDHRQRPILGTWVRVLDGDKRDCLCGLSLLKGEKEETVRLKLPFVPNHVRKQLCGVLLHGSSNGLVLVTSAIIATMKLVEQTIIVWNPATEQYRILPKPNTVNTNIPFSENEKENIDELGERTFKKPIVGFDFIHDDMISSFEYKVARIFGHVNDSGSKYIYRAQIFVQNTNSWREVKNEIELECESHIGGFPSTSVTLNGVLYWKMQRDIGEDKRCSIMSFDLRAEVFNEIQIPIDLNNQDSDWGKLSLFSWKNSLATTAVHYLPDYEKDYLILWSMSDRDNCNNPVWTDTELHINMSVLPKGRIDVMGGWKDRLIIGCRNGVDEDEVDDLHFSRTLLSYDQKTDTMTKILKDGEKIEFGHGILDYVERLTPV